MVEAFIKGFTNPLMWEAIGIISAIGLCVVVLIIVILITTEIEFKFRR